jgi:8-oxo-dGTP diphosphatase
MPTHVAAIAALRNGKLLMGKRRDNGKWNAPGGHVEKGESPLEAAHRELHEETGLKVGPGAMRFHGTTKVKDGKVHVHAFRAFVGGDEPHAKNDPDKEMSEYRWVDPKNLPEDIKGSLHNEPDVILDMLRSTPKKTTPYGALDQLLNAVSQEA